MFKTLYFKPQQKAAVAAPPTYRVTVMAGNVSENVTIQGLQVKRITVDQKKYDEWKAEEKDKGEMLTGNQPIGRVTRVALMAEKPVYANDVKPLHYPEEISKKLEPGKVASIVEVPTRNTMVRVHDHVDLLCTLSNTDPELGPTETRTAVVTADRDGLRFEAGLEGLRVLKTTGSGFSGFLRDAYTTLPETAPVFAFG